MLGLAYLPVGHVLIARRASMSAVITLICAAQALLAMYCNQQQLRSQGKLVLLE